MASRDLNPAAMMMIETDDDYKLAIERLNRLSEAALSEDDQDEFLALTAAMLDYETRNHPALAAK
ncbi:MAG: hypothetical protein K2Z25_23045 [Beijerinckiaceae bacterium]|nr:hypothetical protein [Beijerinckiaceae bacterium]